QHADELVAAGGRYRSDPDRGRRTRARPRRWALYDLPDHPRPGGLLTRGRWAPESPAWPANAGLCGPHICERWVLRPPHMRTLTCAAEIEIPPRKSAFGGRGAAPCSVHHAALAAVRRTRSRAGRISWAGRLSGPIGARAGLGPAGSDPGWADSSARLSAQPSSALALRRPSGPVVPGARPEQQSAGNGHP